MAELMRERKGVIQRSCKVEQDIRMRAEDAAGERAALLAIVFIDVDSALGKRTVDHFAVFLAQRLHGLADEHLRLFVGHGIVDIVYDRNI